jgi:uracil-DNA glycosylase family 4
VTARRAASGAAAGGAAAGGAAALRRLEARVIRCRACPRLVAHREQVATVRRRAYLDQEYWGRPVPALGGVDSRLVLVGLAPAAHGGNRTGRMFTGDRSGDWLYDALFAHGFANQAESTGPGDGLELRGAFITAGARCAPPDNRPTPPEFDRCRTWMTAELRLLPRARVVVALGALAFDQFLKAWQELGGVPPRPRPRHGHGVEQALPALPRAAGLAAGRPLTLLGSYHPSQQNTLTGRLTRPMLHAVFARARALLAAAPD